MKPESDVSIMNSGMVKEKKPFENAKDRTTTFLTHKHFKRQSSRLKTDPAARFVRSADL
jgi:hypothetical protein